MAHLHTALVLRPNQRHSEVLLILDTLCLQIPHPQPSHLSTGPPIASPPGGICCCAPHGWWPVPPRTFPWACELSLNSALDLQSSSGPHWEHREGLQSPPCPPFLDGSQSYSVDGLSAGWTAHIPAGGYFQPCPVPCVPSSRILDPADCFTHTEPTLSLFHRAWSWQDRNLLPSSPLAPNPHQAGRGGTEGFRWNLIIESQNF